MSRMNEAYRGVSVAITGGAGLIGSFLSEHLLDMGADVIVVDDFSKGRRANLAGFNDRLEIREGDLEEPEFARRTLDGAEIIFHLASRAYGVGYGAGRHLEILQHNERLTNNVLEAIAAHRPRRVLVVSSSCVYDDGGPGMTAEAPVFDGDPEQVNRGYGWAKRFLEKKAEFYAEHTGVPITIVRPFNIYGERYRWVGEHSHAVPMLVKRIMDGEDPVTIWGSGRQRRSYIHASDAARMMMALVAAGWSEAPVNLGSEETIAIRDLTALICALTGRAPALITDETKPEGRFVKSADMSRFRQIAPDFTPNISLEEGLRAMIPWYHATFDAAQDHADDLASAS